MYDYERCYYKTIKVIIYNLFILSFGFCFKIDFIFDYFIRGFGFITFKEANSVDKVLTKDVHMLDEKQVCN